jgi:hypothetical protein
MKLAHVPLDLSVGMPEGPPDAKHLSPAPITKHYETALCISS